MIYRGSFRWVVLGRHGFELGHHVRERVLEGARERLHGGIRHATMRKAHIIITILPSIGSVSVGGMDIWTGRIKIKSGGGGAGTSDGVPRFRIEGADHKRVHEQTRMKEKRGVIIEKMRRKKKSTRRKMKVAYLTKVSASKLGRCSGMSIPGTGLR